MSTYAQNLESGRPTRRPSSAAWANSLGSLWISDDGSGPDRSAETIFKNGDTAARKAVRKEAKQEAKQAARQAEQERASQLLGQAASEAASLAGSLDAASLLLQERFQIYQGRRQPVSHVC